MEHARVDIVGLALDLVGPSTVVPNAANDGAHVSTCHVDGLAIVKRLNSSKEVQVLLHDVGKLQQILAPLVGRGLLPYAVESLAGSSHGKVDILLGTLVDLGDDFLVGRVDDIELLLVDGLDPFAIDVAGGGGLLACMMGGLTGGGTEGFPHTGQWVAYKGQ